MNPCGKNITPVTFQGLPNRNFHRNRAEPQSTIYEVDRLTWHQWLMECDTSGRSRGDLVGEEGL
jgi:hypothetical protein